MAEERDRSGGEVKSEKAQHGLPPGHVHPVRPGKPFMPQTEFLILSEVEGPTDIYAA